MQSEKLKKKSFKKLELASDLSFRQDRFLGEKKLLLSRLCQRLLLRLSWKMKSCWSQPAFMPSDAFQVNPWVF